MKIRSKCRTALGFLFLGAFVAPLPARAALTFKGAGQYVTFGRATNLASRTFTLETWFNWSGRGTVAYTGIGGVRAIPLITKLQAEADRNARDGNYFLGIEPTNRVLVADMEEGATGAVPGTNHPIFGVRAITTNVWHHAAVTYDGTNWQMFLDGTLEAARFVGQPPRWDSIQHAALASSLNSTGKPQGSFIGALDEVRIWDHARSALQIATNKHERIPPAPGLLGRWALDETSGDTAHDTSGNGVHGTLIKGPVWSSGHRAAQDVLTPIKLMVVIPERTELLRQAEGRRVPPVYRFDPGVAAQVEKSFLAGFLLTRERFLADMAEAFPGSRVGPQVVSDARFSQLVSSFRKTNKGFPLDAKVARTWALGQSPDRMQADLAAKLRGIAARHILPNQLPPEAESDSPNVGLFSLSLSDDAPDLATVEESVQVCPRTNLCTLAEARDDLLLRFPTNQQAVAKYLAGFLRENCLFEADLTAQRRTRQTESILAAEHYGPGQVIVKQGQVIDAGIRAALEELRARTTEDELRAQAVAEQVRAEAAAERVKADNALRDLRQQTTLAEFKSRLFGQQNRWLLAGLVLVAVVSSITVWQLVRSRRVPTLLPVPLPPGDAGLIPDAEPAEMTAEAGNEEEWKQRALTAERRAAQTSAILRAGLLPHLAQWLKHKLTGRLLADRSRLLSLQEEAARELAELEARLRELQAPLEQRLETYERRIAELEQELAVQGEQSRELIKAKIEMTRRKLAAEQGRDPATWN